MQKFDYCEIKREFPAGLYCHLPIFGKIQQDERKKIMSILPLHLYTMDHTRIVLSLVVQSKLDYGDLDSDARLLTWQKHQGKWAVAVDSTGTVAGIVCVVDLSDCDQDAILWLEVLPQYQHQGVGHALLCWAQSQSQRDLVVKSVSSAISFYKRDGIHLAA